MKIRSGFVSNSSSSSFIVVIDKKALNECPCCHRMDDNILDEISDLNGVGGDDTCLLYRGTREIINNLERYGLVDEEINSLKKDLLRAEAASMDAGWINISYHDEYIDSKLRHLVSNNKAYILYKNI